MCIALIFNENIYQIWSAWIEEWSWLEATYRSRGEMSWVKRKFQIGAGRDNRDSIYAHGTYSSPILS